MLERLHMKLKGHSEDGGFVIGIMALVLMVLLVFAGFAVDVGAWYARGAQVQRAADAAALAGVVWMPDIDQARVHARAAAERNGVVPVAGGMSIAIDPVPGNSRQLQVTIRDPRVERYFSQLVLNSPPTITRSATAEYVLSVPLGSPDNRFGNDPTAGISPNVWASISGPGALFANGDPFATKCYSSGACSASGPVVNPAFRSDGYLWAIDVPAAGANRTLTVEVYDAGQYERSNYPRVETADSGSVNVEFELFEADNTPLVVSDNLVPSKSLVGRCDNVGPGSSNGGVTRGGRFRIPNNQFSSTYRNQWQTICRVNVGTRTGQWFLRVKSSDISGITDSGAGWNQFSLKASLSGAGVSPRVYAVQDLSIFNNVVGHGGGNVSANFYLAEVDAIHAGKALRVALFDPGDGTGGNYYLSLLGPGSSPMACRYKARDSVTWLTSSNCRIQTRSGSTNIYNGRWLDIEVSIPTTYACTPDCWWRVRYEFQNMDVNDSPNDRTVWSANIIGDPVHLID